MRDAMRTGHHPSGFTLIEMMVVLAIIGVMATLGVFAFSSTSKSVKRLDGAALEVRGLLTSARLNALATGNDTAVLFFADANPSQDPNHPGARLVVYEDADGTFFSPAAPVHFTTAYDAFRPTALPPNSIYTTLEVTGDLVFRDRPGRPALVRPFSGVPVTLGCSFCSTTAGNRRGAIVFDYTGRARFYGATGLTGAPLGPPFDLVGGSFTLASVSTGNEITVVVASPTGAVQTIQRAP